MPLASATRVETAVLVACALAVACGDASGPGGRVESVVVTGTPDSLELRASRTYTATALDAAGNPVTGREISWSSADPGIARVTSDGVVEGVSVGSTTITAASGERRGTATVRIVPLRFASVDAGGTHSCAVTTLGGIYCWGVNRRGAFGDGTTSNSATPVRVVGDRSYASVAASPASDLSGHTCALDRSGRAYCWGPGSFGQLGTGASPELETSPKEVAGGLTFQSLTIGYGYTCGLTPAGAAYCWGGNGGRLGDGTTVDRNVPTRVTGGHIFATISAHGSHTCGVTTEGRALCWGWGEDRALGIAEEELQPCGTIHGGRCSFVPRPVVTTLTFRAANVGSKHSCGLTTAGTVYCWGDGYERQLGVHESFAARPVAVTGGHVFRALVTGGYHNCGLTDAGLAYCWGWNGSGQLGTPTDPDRSHQPVAVSGNLVFQSLDASYGGTCGLTVDKIVYCWGWGRNGEIGDGSKDNSNMPVRVWGQ